MNCVESKKYLDAYLDGELEASLMLDVEAHMDSCEVCVSLYQLKKAMKSEIAALGQSMKAPEHLRKRIEALPQKRRRGFWAVGFAGASMAAAAALLIVFVAGSSPGDNEPLAAVVDDVVQRHSRDLPMEIRGSDPREAASWFRGKVDFPVNAPSLKLKNASFQGARLSNVKARQAAHMVYRVDGHKVTLMIFPAEKLSISDGDIRRVNGRDVVTGRRNGYNVAVMIDGDMAYALSSDLSTNRLVALFTDTSI